MNKKNLQSILWGMTEDWSEIVRNRDVLKLYHSLSLNISYGAFMSIFTKFTGYVRTGTKFKRVVYFKDNMLREVALEIWNRGEAFTSYKIYLTEEELVDLTLADTRYFLASEILITMHQIPSLKRRIFNKKDLLGWIKRIAQTIPDSPRWKQIYRKRDEIFKKFEDLHNLEDSEYELLNIGERETEFRIFTDVYDREVSVRNSFSMFLSEVGIDDLKEYESLLAKVGMFFSETYLGLTEAMTEISSEDRMVKRSKFFTYKQIDNIISRYGMSPDRFILTTEKLRYLVLKDLPYSLIPIFYEDMNGLFRINIRLLQLNNFLELCFSLPRAKEEIVNKFKGPGFEDILTEILTGKIIMLYQQDNVFGGSLTTTDEINLERAKGMLRAHQIVIDELRYSYKPPDGITVPRTIIKRDSYPAFSDFLDIIEKEETDIDILLINDDEPKDIILGECEFTRKYSTMKYLAKIRHIKRLRRYLTENQNAKEELNLPLDYPIVPVLFTSFSGSVFRNKDDVVKTTFPPILWGKFKEWIPNYLAKGRRAR